MFRVVELKELALQLLDRIDGEQTKGKLNERVLEEQKDRIETCKTKHQNKTSKQNVKNIKNIKTKRQNKTSK